MTCEVKQTEINARRGASLDMKIYNIYIFRKGEREGEKARDRQSLALFDDTILFQTLRRLPPTLNKTTRRYIHSHMPECAREHKAEQAMQNEWKL